MYNNDHLPVWGILAVFGVIWGPTIVGLITYFIFN